MDSRDSADVCIIGSGPAGAILAASLAERGHDVVILEGGPWFDREERIERMEMGLRPEYSSADVWEMGGDRDAYTWSGHCDHDLNDHRIKAVGGTSLHWGGVTPRLHPEDFEMNSRHGVARDWPISYADLEPYYLEAENQLGVSGAPYQFAGPRSGPYPLPAFPPSYSDGLVSEAAERLGVEFHPVPRAMNSRAYDGRSACQGYGTCQVVCPSGAKYDASVHVEKALDRGARLVDRAPVDRLALGGSDRVAEAVYTDTDGRERRQRARYFVVACGAVESARLLMLSENNEYPTGLANRSGALGRNLMLHPAIRVVGKLDEPTRQNLIGFSTSMSEQFYDVDSGPEGSTILKLSNTAGRGPVRAALGETSHTSTLIDGDFDTLVEGDRWGDQFATEYREESSLVELMAWAEQLPDPDNRVSLDRTTTDDSGDPVPDVTWHYDDRSRETLEAAERICRSILDELGADRVAMGDTPADPLLLSHRMGTTRMGTDPDRSVVGPQLQAHGLSNLYVSSSGVFVTAGAANPTLTIAALTLRLADHLDRQLGPA